MPHEEIVRHGALVEFRTRRDMRVAGERDEMALIDRLRGARQAQESGKNN
jgi:hypothetical protein